MALLASLLGVLRRCAPPRAAAALALVCIALPAHAGAPQVKGQAPGWYRMMLGDFEITALSDGTVKLPVDKLLTNAAPGEVGKALARAHLGSPLETSVNAYLINTGTHLVLIDTGAANLFGPTLGNLLSNLRSSGYQPEQVDEVYITHMHGDHCGGLMSGDQRSFPNAIVRVEKRDADFWLSQANLDKAPEAGKNAFKGAMASFTPYIQAGKFVPFSGATDLVPGVKAEPTYGHTPGHTIYIVESKGEKMAVWGDLMHVAAVQFPNPSVTIQFDSDSRQAAPQRRKAYADAARHGYYVAIAHVSFPGIGRLRANGKGYDWIPVNYSSGR